MDCTWHHWSPKIVDRKIGWELCAARTRVCTFPLFIIKYCCRWPYVQSIHRPLSDDLTILSLAMLDYSKWIQQFSWLSIQPSLGWPLPQFVPIGPCHMRQYTGNQFQAISKKKRHSHLNVINFHLWIVSGLTHARPKWSCSMHCSWLPPSCLQKLPPVTRPIDKPSITALGRLPCITTWEHNFRSNTCIVTC